MDVGFLCDDFQLQTNNLSWLNLSNFQYISDIGIPISDHNVFCYNTISNDNLGILKLLVDKEPNILSNHDLFTEAIKHNSIYVVKYFVENGMDVTVDDNMFIKTAVKFGNFDIAQYLQNNGASYDEDDEYILKDIYDKYHDCIRIYNKIPANDISSYQEIMNYREIISTWIDHGYKFQFNISRLINN